MLKSNLIMFQDKINRIIAGLDDAIEIARANAIQSIYAESLFRIFNEGKDKNENQIGGYSNSYKKVRTKKGYQTGYVDLTFTGTLKNSINRDNKKVFFKNNYGVKISGYNEKNFGKRIFAPSKTEAEVWSKELDFELKKLWKS